MLTEDLILNKCKRHKDIHNIKKLNVFGKDIEDINFLSKMEKLEILSISANKISNFIEKI